jgi:hypothetical protein
MDVAIAAEWEPATIPEREAARAALAPTGVACEVIRAVEVTVSAHQVLGALRSALSAAEMDLGCLRHLTDHEGRRVYSALAEVRSALRMSEALRVSSS